MMKKTITAIILTENDSSWLFRCLDQLQLFSEIIISDTGSNFELKNIILSKYPESNIHYYFDTEIDPRIRYLKYQNVANSDYIMWIHPDEILSSELEAEIINEISSDENFDALAVKPTDVNFGINFGKPNHHTIRVYKKGKLDFSRYKNVHSETFVTGDEIQYVFDLKVKLLQGDYTHYANPYFLLYNYKVFRYEMINAQSKSDNDLKCLVDKYANLNFFSLLILSVKIGWRFFRSYRNLKKFGFGAICYSFGSVLRLMAEIITPREELLYREGKIDFNDTRGYINIKREKK